MITPLDFPTYLNIVLIICLTVGGFFAFRNGRSEALARGQKDTIGMLEQRTKALESKINDLEKQNTVQQHIIDTITSALKQKGMIVTIDGDMVTIQDAQGRRSTHRKHTTTSKKEEDV